MEHAHDTRPRGGNIMKNDNVMLFSRQPLSREKIPTQKRLSVFPISLNVRQHRQSGGNRRGERETHRAGPRAQVSAAPA